MASNLLFYHLLLVALALICLMLHIGWPDDPPRASQTLLESHKGRHKRSKVPKPFTGFLHKPLCAACEQGANERLKAPGSPPPVIALTRGRRRTVDTKHQFCPEPDCAYPGRPISRCLSQRKTLRTR